MQRKLWKLKSDRADQLKAAETALQSGDNAAYDAAMEKVKGFNTEIENVEKFLTEQGRFGTEGAPCPDEVGIGNGNTSGQASQKSKKAFGTNAFLKTLRKEKLDQNEAGLIKKSLITGDNALSGENFLVPEDVSTQIRELRRSYLSAKDYVTVTPTDSISGSVTYEEGGTAELMSFDDGDAVPDGEDPKFRKNPYTIKFKGRLIPISAVLLRLASGLMSYIKKYFVRGAILTENKAIFARLAAGKANTPVAVTGLAELKTFINTKLDPSFVKTGFILTNQSGFNDMDQEKDDMGNFMLQRDPADPTKKVFQGMPIVVFSDKELLSIDETHHPMFVGDTAEGCEFKEFEGLLFATSDHYLFNKNQECLRLIEGFDVVSADTEAYGYLSYTRPVSAQ